MQGSQKLKEELDKARTDLEMRSGRATSPGPASWPMA
jgi:hypothetical protein